MAKLKPYLLVLLLALSLCWSLESVEAVTTNTKSFSNFDVGEIFRVDNSENGSENLTETLINQSRTENLSPLTIIMLRVINILSLLTGTFSFIVILISGVLWLTSSGNSSQVDRGKSALLSAIIGLVLSLFAWTIVTFVESFFI